GRLFLQPGGYGTNNISGVQSARLLCLTWNTTSRGTTWCVLIAILMISVLNVKGAAEQCMKNTFLSMGSPSTTTAFCVLGAEIQCQV
ncbi:hypothetical protein Y032_0568g64, partial [Ancylostoma ceylanicum]